MTVHFRREIETLKKSILSLSAQVEERVWQAVRAVEKRDTELARAVIDGDYEIDTREVEIEEECLKQLALYQPVALDLRFIIAILKMNNDLERIGDLAVNIAERAMNLAHHEAITIPFDLMSMAQNTREMLKKSLDSLVNRDPGLAREVCQADQEVDESNRNVFAMVKQGIREQPEKLDIIIQFLLVARHLERIADLSTNIAEDVIYMVEGMIVRHMPEYFDDDSPAPGGEEGEA